MSVSYFAEYGIGKKWCVLGSGVRAPTVTQLLHPRQCVLVQHGVIGHGHALPNFYNCTPWSIKIGRLSTACFPFDSILQVINVFLENNAPIEVSSINAYAACLCPRGISKALCHTQMRGYK